MVRVCRASILVLACVALPHGNAAADVIDRSPSGFTVKTMVAVAASPQRVYQELLNPGSWWDKEHTYSGDSNNLTLAAAPGGCFCERFGGRAVEHGRIITVLPNTLLRLSGALGPLQELATVGTLTWAIEPAKQGSGSMLTMTYAAAGYAPGGLDRLADIVNTVLSRQVQLLTAHLEKGR